jgi:hypothetical protein
VEPVRRASVAARTLVLAVGGSIVLAGLLGGLFVLLRGKTNTSLALGYYILGSVIVLAGSFPSGGIAGMRTRTTERRPTGATGYALPSMLLGAALIGVGTLVDVYKPF